jgi:hypothetical protein
MKAHELPLSTRLKKLEKQGILDVLPDNYKKKPLSPIPVSDDIAQVFLREDRENG